MPDETKQPELQDNKNLVELAKKKRQINLLNKLHKGSLTNAEIRELEQFEGGPLPPAGVRTQEEVAKALHVSVRTVQYWVRDGMPRAPEGYYDLIDIQAWRAVKKEKDKTPDERDKIKWEVKHREYRARLAELELKKAYGEVINKEEVMAGRKARILAVKRPFMAIPTAIAPSLVGKDVKEIRAILSECIRDILKQFSSEDISENKGQKARESNLE